MSSTSVVRSLKVAYKEDLRRFPVVDGKLPSVKDLSNQLQSAYGLKSISMKYVDDEEDLVTVVNDSDLVEAVQIAAGQGKSIVRLHIYSNDVPVSSSVHPTNTTASTLESKNDSPKVDSKPSPVQEKQQEKAAQPTASTTKEPTGSSSSKPSAETVLSALKEFFGNQAILAALPTAVSLFLDTLVSTADVGQAIRFTLDSQPALKSTALVKLGTSYLDVALPYIEQAVGPLREFLTSIGAAGMNQIKATIQTFSLFVLPMVSGLVSRLTAANLEQAWSIIQGWSADPSQPFPVDELKSIVGFGGCGRGGPFGRHHGAHGGPFGGHPFAGFGCGRGGWRRRAAEAQAAQQQTGCAQADTQQQQSPFVDVMNLVGAGQSGIQSLLGQFFPPSQTPSQPQGESSSSSSTPSSDDAPKSDVHPNIICDMCGMSPIKGLRFKCTVCHDYDLCAGCEAKNTHDATHPLLKLHAPVQKRCGGGYNWKQHVHGHHGHGGRHGWRCGGESSASAAAAPTGPSMKFVKDLNIADRTPVGPNAVLIKKWLLENDGATAWPLGSKLIFTRGDRELVDGEEFPVPDNVAAGTQVEVSAVLKTPAIPGRYQAFFRLADSERNTFGNRIWTDLFVVPEAKPVSASAPPAEEKSTEPVVPTPVVPVVAPTPVLVKPVVEESKPAATPVSAPAPAVYPTIDSSAAVSSPSSLPATEPTGKYATELGLLAGMGFKNVELNTFLLDSKKGDLVQVANWLLEKMK